jgi:hypothetical protein
MADIDVERKGGMGWLWWILGLLLLALVIWWIAAAGDDEAEVAEVVEPAPVVTPTTTPEPIAQGPLCVAQVLAAPTTYVGQSLGECEMRVVEVVSDRGFWIEENGQRVFVVVNEASAATTGVADVQGRQAERPDINAGQTVRIGEAMVLDNVANLAGPLDQQTQNIAQNQPWFLAVDAENVNMQGVNP